MSESAVAIVGSGIAATAIAYHLARRGHDVAIFEKGPEFPYPHSQQFQEEILYGYRNPRWRLPRDLKNLTLTGDYQWDLNNSERGMVVGGSATHWTGITPRMNPEDFATRARFGFGTDWPLTYADLESYYCASETLIGVAGTDADNPFAPPRSRPFPLPPFSLSYGDRILAQRLKHAGLVLHTTPQARTRQPFDDRPGCQNFGTCETCPIGARYSPNHHLSRAQATGRCRILPNTSVRRVVLDASGKARALVFRRHDGPADEEHGAKVIIVAAGGIESPRLLLLSTDRGHANGLGNRGGHVGRHLAFHHSYYGAIEYKTRLDPGGVGAFTGISRQFSNPADRGRHGGVLIEFSSSVAVPPNFLSDRGRDEPLRSGSELRDQLATIPYQRFIGLQAESVPDERKYVSLSTERDRFGDPFAHVAYTASAFDYDSHRFASSLFERYVTSTAGEPVGLRKAHEYDSGAHHMGTCRMGRNAGDSVVDSFGEVHDVPNLFVAGSAIFAGASGPFHPTLTLVALALRAAEKIERRLA